MADVCTVVNVKKHWQCMHSGDEITQGKDLCVHCWSHAAVAILQVTCVLSLAAHNSCVWDICPISAPALSPGGFQQQPARCATCAADGTVRLWNLAADTAAGTGRLIAGMMLLAWSY